MDADIGCSMLLTSLPEWLAIPVARKLKAIDVIDVLSKLFVGLGDLRSIIRPDIQSRTRLSTL